MVVFTCLSYEKNKCLLSKHRCDLKRHIEDPRWRPNTMSLQGHYLRKFPALYIIIINRMVACAHRVALAVLRGGQTASAESCTHPAKRDLRFPPPIAKRQRLSNVRIIHPCLRYLFLATNSLFECYHFVHGWIRNNLCSRGSTENQDLSWCELCCHRCHQRLLLWRQT